MDNKLTKKQFDWEGTMIITGIIRKFDDLGRIAIPRMIRQEAFGTYETDRKPMEIFYEKDGTIILKPVKEEAN